MDGMKSALRVFEGSMHVFKESFTVMELASGLASFDAEMEAEKVKEVMEQRGYYLAGIRERGIMTGYVNREELTSGICKEYMHSFSKEMILKPSASFAEVIKTLDQTEWAFIRILGRVLGIVTRTDLLKPPMRMWLFGIITSMEMTLENIIRSYFPDDSWMSHISEGRLTKARSLQGERRRRRQQVDLVSCLQFSDKGQIVMRNANIRESLEIPSHREGQERIRKIEDLRNNLAHSQDIVTQDWATMVRVSENLENTLRNIRLLNA